MIDANAWLELGLGYGRNNWINAKLQKKREGFKQWCGIYPDTCAKVWSDLIEQDILEDGSAKPQHFLLALRWLKAYDYEHQLKKEFGFDEKTIRKWVRFFIVKIEKLKQITVRNLLCLQSFCVESNMLFSSRLLQMLTSTMSYSLCRWMASIAGSRNQLHLIQSGLAISSVASQESTI